MEYALPKRVQNLYKVGFLSPSVFVSQLDLRVGDRVLEIGLPVGFFASALRELVKDKGLVYVSGIHKDSFDHLHTLLKKANVRKLLNSDLISGNTIQEGTLDLAIMTNIFSMSRNAQPFCIQIARYLKPEARVVVVDWNTKTKNTHIGPEMSKRVSKNEAIRKMRECGFEFVKTLEAQGYHFGLLFKPLTREFID